MNTITYHLLFNSYSLYRTTVLYPYAMMFTLIPSFIALLFAIVTGSVDTNFIRAVSIRKNNNTINS